MSGKPVSSVLYNDGENADVFAIEIKDNGGGSLNLYVIPESGEAFVENDVPLREKADYGDEGGGRTYHVKP